MLRLLYRLKRKTEQTFKPVILVTGCGSGIGWALAELLYSCEGYRVVVTARSRSIARLKLRFRESERFRVLSLDIRDENERLAVIGEIEDTWGGVDILVNNAGIMYRSVLEHMTERDEQNQMVTNYLGPSGLIRAVLPHMRAAGRGKIINVSSVSGMLAMPTMASYSASKHALEGMSEALWFEMKPLGINVSLVQPGFIRSNSFKNVYYTENSRPDVCVDAEYSDYYKNMTPFVERLMNLSLATPEKISKLILKVIRTENPPMYIPATLDAFIFSYLKRWIPRRILFPLLFALLPKARQWGKAYTKRRQSRQGHQVPKDEIRKSA